MTFDGYVAFATEQGIAGTIPRQPSRMTNANLRTLSFNGARRCADESIALEDLEEVSNSIAADEDGGIYIVTSKRMRRVNHDARRNRLTSAVELALQRRQRAVGHPARPRVRLDPDRDGRRRPGQVRRDHRRPGPDARRLLLARGDPGQLGRPRRRAPAPDGVRVPGALRRPASPRVALRAVGERARVRDLPRPEPARLRLQRSCRPGRCATRSPRCAAGTRRPRRTGPSGSTGTRGRAGAAGPTGACRSPTRSRR